LKAPLSNHIIPGFFPPAAQSKAEAEARHDTVVMSLSEKERRLGEAKAELDKAYKETRHVESQVGRGC